MMYSLSIHYVYICCTSSCYKHWWRWWWCIQYTLPNYLIIYVPYLWTYLWWLEFDPCLYNNRRKLCPVCVDWRGRCVVPPLALYWTDPPCEIYSELLLIGMLLSCFCCSSSGIYSLILYNIYLYFYFVALSLYTHTYLL